MDARILRARLLRRTLVALGMTWCCASMAWASQPSDTDDAGTTVPIPASIEFLRTTPESRERGAASPYSLKSGSRQTGPTRPGYTESAGPLKPDAASPVDGALLGDTRDTSPRPYVRVEQPTMRRYSGVEREKQLGPDVTVYGFTERTTDMHEANASRREAVGGGVRVTW